MSKKTPVLSHDPLSGLDEPVYPPPAGGAVSATPEPLGDEVAGGQVTEAAADTVGAAVFELPDTLTIADVAGLHRALVVLLEDSSTLVLDGAAVEMVDGAGLQLLTAVFKEAVARQVPVQWQAASAALRRGAKDLGVGVLLGLEDERAA